MANDRVINYVPTPTGNRFHLSEAPVKAIRGPVGSAKSVTCCFDMFLRSNKQKCVDGVRWSTWLVGRNTYSNLMKTTIPTWKTWFPKTELHMSPPLSGRLEMPSMSNPEREIVRIDLLFMSLDSPTIIDDLKSLEISGAWLNEATQTRQEVVTEVISRIGRFRPHPGVAMEELGLLMDTNSPDETNWWYELETRLQPEGWEFFVQPPGLLKRVDAGGMVYYEDNDGRDYATRGIPAAENVKNLPGGFEYYRKQLPTSEPDRIKRLILNEFGSQLDGRPVYPEWSESVHLSKVPLPFEPGAMLLLGTDFGRTPAVVIGQMGVSGQLRILEEVLGENISTDEFIAERLKPLLINKYRFPITQVINWADPAGDQGDQVVQETCIQKYNQYGIRTAASPVPGNRFDFRRDTVGELLRQHSLRGEAAILIDPSCTTLRKGFNGGYRYRQTRVAGGGEQFSEAPEKNAFSHPHDALQYLCYGVFKSGFDWASPTQNNRFTPLPQAALAGGMNMGGMI